MDRIKWNKETKSFSIKLFMEIPDDATPVTPPFYSRNGVVIAIDSRYVYTKSGSEIKKHTRNYRKFKPIHDVKSEWRRWYQIFPEAR